MRHLIIFFPLLICLFGFSQKKTNEQNGDIIVDKQIKGGIIAGMNLTQVDGDEVYGFSKVGFNGGFTAIIPIAHRFSFGIETLYTQKGSYCKYPVYVGDTSPLPYYKLNLDYLEVPLLVMFEDKSTWTFGTGFSWGRLVSKKEMEHGVYIDSNLQKYPYKTSDFQWLFDLRFRIWKHLKFNVRYSYSIAKIRDRHYDNGVSQWDRKQYNNVITFRLIYLFNEKYLPPVYRRDKKKKDRKRPPPIDTKTPAPK